MTPDKMVLDLETLSSLLSFRADVDELIRRVRERIANRVSLGLPIPIERTMKLGERVKEKVPVGSILLAGLLLSCTNLFP
jgi:hypothetical protein